MWFPNIPFARVNWVTSSFLIGTFLLTLIGVPLYIWQFGIDVFQIALFFVLFVATGLSITLGYHRLFSHMTFKAKWPVKLFVLIFGAAAFENSVLLWSSEHRAHHKHVDHDDDPYSIQKGFFYAHIGWLLFKLNPEEAGFKNVADLKKDPLVMWQHRYVHWIALVVSFIFPTVLGALWGGASGALGAFLIGGVARVVAVQHCTFFINSACHTLGSQPYSARCSARDSWFMALFTFGEGYHNFHHEFQHDYRNGVKPWQFDPTKWSIWILYKLGLASGLRRVPSEKILLAQIEETQRLIDTKLQTTNLEHLSESTRAMIASSRECLHELAQKWLGYQRDCVKNTELRIERSREAMKELRRDWKLAIAHIKRMHRLQAVL